MNTLSMIGCGNLGLPTALEGLKNGWAVKGSSTSQAGCDRLKAQGITPVLFSTDAEFSKEALTTLWDADVVVITIPFKRTLQNPFQYPEGLKQILTFATDKTKQVIMTSSTAAYPDTSVTSGLAVWTEDDKILSETPRRKALLEAEKAILDVENKTRKSCVLRLAGLIGPDRQPGKWAKEDSVINNPDVRVNLVHQEDVVRFIWSVIDKSASGIFNVCSDDHPTKREFYTKAARQMALSAPKFSANNAPISSKIVSNTKGKERLAFTYTYSSPMEMLF